MSYPIYYRVLIESTCVLVVILNLIILPIILYTNKWILTSFKLVMMVFAVTNVAHLLLDAYASPVHTCAVEATQAFIILGALYQGYYRLYFDSIKQTKYISLGLHFYTAVYLSILL